MKQLKEIETINKNLGENLIKSGINAPKTNPRDSFKTITKPEKLRFLSSCGIYQ